MMACPWNEIILLTGRFYIKMGFCMRSNTYQNPSLSSKSKDSAVFGSQFDATIPTSAHLAAKQYGITRSSCKK